MDRLILNGCTVSETQEHGCRVLRWREGYEVWRVIENYDGTLDLTHRHSHAYNLTATDVMDILAGRFEFREREVDWRLDMEMELWDD